MASPRASASSASGPRPSAPPPMASSSDVSSLVEHLAEAEQLLSGGSNVSGSNSGVANEERDSVIEATAQMDELERSSVERSSSLSLGSRSDVCSGSDVSRRSRSSRLQASAASSTDGAAQEPARPAPQEEDELLQLGPGVRQVSLVERMDETRSGNVTDKAEALALQAVELAKKGEKLKIAEMMQQELEKAREAKLELAIEKDEKEAKAIKIKEVHNELENVKEEKDVKIAQVEQELANARESKKAEVAEMQQALVKTRVAAAKDVVILKSQIGREKDALKVQLKVAEQEGARVKREKEVLKANVRSMQKNIAVLKGVDPSPGENDEGEPQDQLPPAVATLAETPDDASPAQRPRKVDVGDLSMMPDGQLHVGEYSPLRGLSTLSSQLVGRQVRRARRAAPAKTRLEVIEEPDDVESLDGSGSCFSGGLNVSSAAGGAGVGDLRDFEEVPVEVLDLIVDENELLQEAVAAEKSKAREMQEAVAAKEAKIENLRENLTEIQEELDAAKEAKRPLHNTMQQALIDELTEQLNSLREANRIAEARAVDLMCALRSEEMRHKREKDELVQKLQGSARHNADDVNSEISKLRESLRSMQQEKNVLVNDFEWKELQWTTKIENAQLEVEDLKRRLASEASMHQRRIEALEASAKEAMEASVSLSSFAQAEREPAIALGWLRCPVRSAGPPPVDKFAFCQETCWKVVTEISGIVALWCSANEHVIRQASREANRLWGSSMLEGQSVFSLASGPSSASWLKRALQSHQRIADMGREDQGLTGFIVRDLGSETFVSKGGDTFDASVITAHFPAEPGRGKQAGVLVILELQAALGGASGHAAGLGGGGQSSRSRGAPSSRGHRRGDGTSSEVSSVSPSDSASNVLGFTHSAW